VSVTVTDLDKTVPPLFARNYLDTLEFALQMRDKLGWRDLLASTAEVLAAAAFLLGNNKGHFLVIESDSPGQSWLWLSPEAIKHLEDNGYPVLKRAEEIAKVDPMVAYQDILVSLGRDPMGRKIRAANVAA